jgi:hypothetical protein
MATFDFRSLPPGPDAPTSGAVLARLVEGIGFRFFWATEGLGDSDLAYRPTPETMCIHDLARHVLGLATWVAVAAGALAEAPPSPGPDTRFPEMRERALEVLARLRERLARMDDEEISAIRLGLRGETHPWPHLVNGPLADALTHVGQINLLRRSCGNPVPKANVFLGRPPG